MLWLVSFTWVRKSVYTSYTSTPNDQPESVVYSGDTNSVTDNMIVLAQDADVLIYDTEIMDDAPSPEDDPVFFVLHTTPTRLGQVAAASNTKRLILSHITPVTEDRLSEVKAIVRAQGYRGKVKAAHDLMVINVGAKRHNKRHHDDG